MRWLGAAVRSGRLGCASAAPSLPLLESFVDSCQEAEAVAEQCSVTEAADNLDGHAGNKATERATSELVSQGEKGFGSSGASNSIGSNKTARKAAGGRAWPWTPCRSVVQLLGCDVWQGPTAAACPAAATTAASRRTPTVDEGLPGSDSRADDHGCSSSTGNTSASQEGSGAAGPASGVGREAYPGGLILPGCCCTNGPVAFVLDAAHEQAQKESCCEGPRGLVHAPTTSTLGNQQSRETAPAPLLDMLVRDVELQCRGCGAVQACYFLAALKLFKRRTVYSSAGMCCSDNHAMSSRAARPAMHHWCAFRQQCI